MKKRSFLIISLIVLIILGLLVFVYLYLDLDIFADEEIEIEDYSQTQIYYDFEGSYDDELDEIVIEDQAGKINGVLSNPRQVEISQEGSNFGNQVDFKGKDSIVTIGADSLEGFGDSFSLMVWCKPNQFNKTANGRIISRKDSFALHFWQERLIFNTWSREGKRDASLIYDNIAEDEWFQVSAVFNKGQKQLYINGQLIGDNNLSYQEVGGVNNPIELNGEWFGNYYDGSLDEVRLFNYPLDRDDILDYSKLPFKIDLASRQVIFSPVEKLNLDINSLNKDKSKQVEIQLLDGNEEIYRKRIRKINDKLSHSLDYTHSGPPEEMSLVLSYSGDVNASYSQPIYFDQERRLENLIYYGWWQKYGEIDEKVVNSLADSPFDSFTPYLMSAYSDEILDIKDFKQTINAINSQDNLNRKEFWPRLFFNQIYSCSDNTEKDYQYCREIEGMDLWDEQEELSRLLDNYRTSLEIAKQTQAGGLVVDNEAYNNKKLYNFDYLASQADKSKAECREALKDLGYKLADITNEVYPNSKILFLFGHFHFDSTARAITEGMLERAKDQSYNFKVIDGSEGLVWYLHTSRENLRERIERQNKYLSQYVSKYPNLYLGGTKGLYLDASKTRGLWQDWYRLNQDSLEIRTISDQTELLSDLFKSRKYVWIYGAGAAGEKPFNEYDRESAKEYDQVISQALCGNGYCDNNRAETESSCEQDCSKADVDMGGDEQSQDEANREKLNPNQEKGEKDSLASSDDKTEPGLAELISREEFPSFKELAATGPEGGLTENENDNSFYLYFGLAALLLTGLIGGIIYIKKKYYK